MNVLGIDIGYSNLKLAFGKAGHNPQRGFRPVSRPRRELDRPLNPSGSTPDPAFGAI